MSNLRRVLQFFRAEWPLAMAAAGLVLLNVGAGLLKPWPLAVLVDSVLGQRPLPGWLARITEGSSDFGRLALLTLAVFVVHFGQSAVAAGQSFLLIKAGLRGLARVRQAVFERLLRLSLRARQSAPTGDLIYRATWDTCAFQTLFQHGLFAILAHALALGLMLVVMLRLNVALTVVAFATAPPLLFAMRAFGRRMQARGVAAHAADAGVASLIQQGIVSALLIQACGREPTEGERFRTATETARQQRLAQHGWEIIYLVAIALVFALGTAAIVGIGAQQVLAGRLTLGSLLVFLAYLGQLYEPLNQLSHAGVTWADATAGTQRVFELLDSPSDLTEAPEARAIEATPGPGPAVASAPRSSTRPEPDESPLRVQGQIEFAGVACGYHGEVAVLQNLSFRIAAGQTVAVVGPSGAGKTTLLQLVPRFLDPVQGAVRLDGVDLRTLRLRELRRQVAFVVQEPILLAGTIGENIAYAREGATPEDVVAAARAAHADDFIRRLPQGYDTPIGEGAARLSAGEKQRLNLARAFLKNAPILLLDEPTNALDAESEALVSHALEHLRRGRTTLLVTHRREAVRAASLVLVLERGQLVEAGPPAELLDKAGGYCGRMSA